MGFLKSLLIFENSEYGFILSVDKAIYKIFV